MENNLLEERLKKFMRQPDDGLTDDQVLDLLDENGNVKERMELPSEYLLEVYAGEVVGQTSEYERAKEAYRAARHVGNNSKAADIFAVMRYSQLVTALILRAHPEVRKIATEMARMRARETQRLRTVELEKGTNAST